MNFFKKFLLYFSLILGVFVAIVLIILAVMYFAPGTQILNYKYLNYKENHKVVFNADSEIKPADFVAIEVNTKRTQVYFKPSDVEGTVYYVHHEGMSGFVKAETSTLTVNASIEEKTYSEETGGTLYKTLVLDVIEPEGILVSTNDPYITVFVPSYYIPPVSDDGSENPFDEEVNTGGSNPLAPPPDPTVPNLKVLSANTEEGRVGFSSKNGDYISNVEKFYGNSFKEGNIQIDNPKYTKNYYFYTNSGEVKFNNPTTVEASIKLTTDNGKLTFVDADQEAVLTGNLEVYSYVDNKGPEINFTKINGNVKIVASYVKLTTKRVGLQNAQTTFAITADKSDIAVGESYARFTLASKSTKNQNNVSINRLYYDKTTDDHIIDAGSGNVEIGTTIGGVGIDATSGNVEIDDAFDNVKIVTTSGNIAVEYNLDAKLDEADREVKGNLTIDTETGDVVVDNMRGALNVKVSSVKAEGKMDIHYLSIKNDSNIKAGNREVNILLSYSENVSGGGIGRLMLLKGFATFDLTAGANSQIGSGDNDYIDNSAYNAQYRVGYSTSSNVYTSALYGSEYGVIVIEGSGVFVEGRTL